MDNTIQKYNCVMSNRIRGSRFCRYAGIKQVAQPKNLIPPMSIGNGPQQIVKIGLLLNSLFR